MQPILKAKKLKQMDLESIRLQLETVERIFFKQAVWDLRVIAQLVDRIPVDNSRRAYFVGELRNAVRLNPVRLRWVWWHNDIRELINEVCKETSSN